MFGLGRYHAMKTKAATLPSIQVTKDEYIVLMMAEGKSKEEAEQSAWIAEQMGADTMIGDKMVGIKK